MGTCFNHIDKLKMLSSLEPKDYNTAGKFVVLGTTISYITTLLGSLRHVLSSVSFFSPRTILSGSRRETVWTALYRKLSLVFEKMPDKVIFSLKLVTHSFIFRANKNDHQYTSTPMSCVINRVKSNAFIVVIRPAPSGEGKDQVPMQNNILLRAVFSRQNLLRHSIALLLAG